MANFKTIFLIIFGCLTTLAISIDIRVLQDTDIRFGPDDIVTEKNSLKKFEGEKRQNFIGDLVIGDHRSQETVFRRTIDVSNPTEDVYRTSMTLSVNNGIIHYMSVQNEPGSFAVACDELKTLGGSTSRFNLRVIPSSKSTLTLVIAAH